MLTDSPVSPLARYADRVLIVSAETPSFFNSMNPAMAAAEALITLMVAPGGASRPSPWAKAGPSSRSSRPTGTKTPIARNTQRGFVR